jgi:hypothetical protein
MLFSDSTESTCGPQQQNTVGRWGMPGAIDAVSELCCNVLLREAAALVGKKLT